jgi:hypothetical protein
MHKTRPKKIVDSCSKGGVFLILLLLSVPRLHAQNATLFTQASTQGPSGSGCNDQETASAECKEQGNVAIGPSSMLSFGSAASARAAFGSLGTAATALTSCTVMSGSGINCFQPATTVASAQSSFSDSFTISNAPPSGSLSINIHTFGVVTDNCIGPDTPFICQNFSSVLGVQGNPSQNLPLSNGENVFHIPQFFTSNNGIAQVGFGLLLSSAVTCGQSNDSTCNLTEDFLHTAVVTGITVLDASGNPVQGATLTSASGTNYNSTTSAFSAFSAKLDVFRKGFDEKSIFALGADSQGIDPAIQAVTLQIGTYSALIPPKSFHRNSKGAYVFEGRISGVKLEIKITPLGQNRFAFKAEGTGVNLTELTDPVTVTLTIGNNTGVTTTVADRDKDRDKDRDE